MLKLKLFEELKVLGFVFELIFILLLFKLLLLLLSFGGFIVNELLSFKSPNKSSNFFVGLISFFCSNCCWALILNFSASSLSLFFCWILKFDSYDKWDTKLFTIFKEASFGVSPFLIALFWLSSTISKSSSSSSFLLLILLFKFIFVLLFPGKENMTIPGVLRHCCRAGS